MLTRNPKTEGRVKGGRAKRKPIVPRSGVSSLESRLRRAEIDLHRARDDAAQALEQQKALAEVLGTISSSIADTKPVFDKILASCQRLFEGYLVGVTLVSD